MKTVPLGGKKAAGRVARVDDDDFALVMQYSWHVWERPGNGPYAQANIWRDGKRTTARMHALITGWPQTDHRDHDGLNNQRYNLRTATDRQNSANTRPRVAATSPYKGVRWYPQRAKWGARICVGGSSRFLGLHLTGELAARAYDAAALEAFGEYAYLNFPGEEFAALPEPPGGVLDDAGEPVQRIADAIDAVRVMNGERARSLRAALSRYGPISAGG